MAGCPDCLHGRPSSRIRDDVLLKCRRNQAGKCFACQKLVDLSRKIDAARQTLQALLDEKEDLASIINQHHDPFARSLPVEVTSAILIHCRPKAPPDNCVESLYDEEELIRDIFNPSHVCKNWRRISHSTPQVWNVVCTTVNPTNCILSVPIIQDWLARSRELPLTISLHANAVGNERQDMTFALTLQRVVVSLAQHGQRWEGLRLQLQLPATFLERVLKVMPLPTSRLANLKDVKINIDNGEGNLQSFILGASPRRISHLGGCYGLRSPSNYNQLEHYYSHGHSVEQAVQLFKVAPRLTTCHIKWLADRLQSQQALQTVVVQFLTSLIVDSPCSACWDAFTLPSLRTLHTVPDTDDPQHWDRLESFIRRSGCNLRELKITSLDEGRATALRPLWNLLRLTPDVERLFVVGKVDAESLFSEMNDAATSAEGGRTHAA